MLFVALTIIMHLMRLLESNCWKFDWQRYRTPSRSRSRSRSYTPPHWRQAQARVVPLSEYQKRIVEKSREDKGKETSPRQRFAYFLNCLYLN